MEQKNRKKAHEMVWPLNEVEREHTCAKSGKDGIDTVKRPRGRPRLTWIELMRKQLEAMGLTWEEASHQAGDHEHWKDIVGR